MGVIHIDNVDDKVLDTLRVRARANGRTFEDEVKAVLDEAAGEAPSEDFVTEALRIRAMTPKGARQTDSTEIVRELRDRGYAGS